MGAPALKGKGVVAVIGRLAFVMTMGASLLLATGPAGHAASMAAVPSPDPTFGTGGTVTCGEALLGSPWNFDGTTVTQIEVRGGLIYVGGSADYYSRPKSLPFVAVHEPDGTPAPGWAGGRPRVVRMAGQGGQLQGMTVAADGSVVLAGLTGSRDLGHVFVLRLTSSGARDRSFSGDGTWVSRVGGALQVRSGLDAHGRSYVAATVDRPGHAANPIGDVWVWRLSRGGRTDPGYGRHGRQVIDQRRSDAVAAMAVTGDGHANLALLGMSFASYGEGERAPKDPPALLVRLGPAGHYDPRFSRDGLIPFRIQRAGFTDPLGVDVDANGRVIVGTTSQDFVGVSRWLRTGRPDPTYGSRGSTRLRPAWNAYLPIAGRLTTHGYVVAGFDFSYGRRSYLARFAPDGGADPTFGTGGQLLIRLWPVSRQSMEVAQALAEDDSGRLLVGGAAGYDNDVGKLSRLIAE